MAELKIRGVAKQELSYLKSIARKKSLSLNQLLLHVLREYCEQKQSEKVETIYLAHLEQMKEEVSTFLKKETEENRSLLQLEKNFAEQAEALSSCSWFE